jgi:putative ABC transport system permease protein
MAIKTLWSSLWRSPIGPLLLAAQVALGMMVLANVAYVVSVRFETTGRPTGIDLENIFWIRTEAYGENYDQQSAVQIDLEYLNSLPGVLAASATSAIPQTSVGQLTAVSGDAEQTSKRSVIMYQTTEKSLETLGLRLLHGRGYGKDAVVPAPSGAGAPTFLYGPEVVITQALAEKIYGSSEAAIGKTLYFSLAAGHPAAVVGVVERLQAAPMFLPGMSFVNEVVLAPAVPAGPEALYLVRTKPNLRDQVVSRVVKEFEPLQRDRYIDKLETLADTAAAARRADRAGAVVLAILASFVLAVTMLGLFGFASFAVTSRTKEIGTRRAIGATRADILKQFLLENWLITSVGVVVGSVLTLAFALQLSLLLELPRLPIVFLVGSMVLVWACGILAALAPALRGAAVAPAVATRVA